MPYSRLMRAVLAPLHGWMQHPWAVFWLTMLATWVVTSEVMFRRSRFLGGFIVFATVVGSVSFAQGLRVTWKRSRVQASVILLLALVVGLVAHAAWKTGVDRSRAEALCAAAVVGGPVAGLQAKAEDLGLAVRSSPARTEPEGKVRPATITGWSGGMFSFWFCTVEHGDGKVLGKRTYFLNPDGYFLPGGTQCLAHPPIPPPSVTP